MSCIEITVLWLSISVCRPEASPKASSACSGHRSARTAPEVAVQQLERARERLRVEEKELAEVLRLVRGN
jgi:hypothetical protein